MIDAPQVLKQTSFKLSLFALSCSCHRKQDCCCPLTIDVASHCTDRCYHTRLTRIHASTLVWRVCTWFCLHQKHHFEWGNVSLKCTIRGREDAFTIFEKSVTKCILIIVIIWESTLVRIMFEGKRTQAVVTKCNKNNFPRAWDNRLWSIFAKHLESHETGAERSLGKLWV